MYVDPSGHIAISFIICTIAVLLFTPIGGMAAQTVVSAASYVGISFISIFNEDIRNDMNAIGWNPFNTDDSLVYASKKVSFYKGVPVFRTNMERSGSFYAILLKKNYRSDEIKHEWGHNVQAMLMGAGNYLLTVGVMSPLTLRRDKWGGYYNSPWEAGADYFGGVSYRKHTDTEISRAMWYLGLGMFFFPLTYIFLI